MNQFFTKYLAKDSKAAPLAVFRLLFGMLMFISVIRFWWNGWIEKLYIEPEFHFHYSGFGWVEIPGNFTYVLFILLAISSIFIAVGFRYKLAISSFFLLFTYIELLDKTTYLNHYYFISILSFLMIFLPMHRYFSIDAQRSPTIAVEFVPNWTINALKLLLAIVYIYAGIAKINSDWMLRAMPLTLWLPTKFNIPLLGWILHEKWMHYLFSWAGALYDLSIVFLLLYKRTRILAFILVIIFHVLTRILFPIGMFPYIMIVGTMIFFDPKFHLSILNNLATFFRIDMSLFNNGKRWKLNRLFWSKIRVAILLIFFSIQILFPLRYLLYSGNVFWTEQGYRFSWRVMLMEKTGYANFKIVDSKTGKRFYVQNQDFLTSFQEKQMSTQADFIVEYAQYLGNHFQSQGHENIQVFVESYASLNGRKNQVYVKPDIDLLTVNINDNYNKLISPFNE